MKTKTSKVVWLFAAIAAAFFIFGAFYYDSEFRTWIITLQGPNWKQTPEYMFFWTVSKYGDWPQLIGITALAAMASRKLHDLKWSKIFLTALVASALAGTVATSCRSLTGRTRPDVDPKTVVPGWYGPYHKGKILIGVPSHNSFPSGHTATAVGLAAVILYSRPRWGIPCMLIALSIAASRLYLGKHHLSDVGVSLILGLAVAWGVWKVSGKTEPARLQSDVTQ